MDNTRTHSSRALFARVWRDYMRKRLGLLALTIALMVVEGSMIGALSFMLQPMFDVVFIGGDQGAIWWVSGIIMVIFVIRSMTGVTQRTFLARISQQMMAELQVDMLRHILRLEYQFFQGNSPGTLISRIQGDTLAIAQVWQVLIRGAGRDFIALISLLAVAIHVDWRWTLVAIVATPLLILPSAIAQRYVRRKSRQAREVAAGLSTRLDEVFHGVETVKVNTLEAYQTGRFQGLMNRSVNHQVKAAMATAVMPGLVDLTIGLGLVLVLLFGAGEIIAGDKTVGQFMSFFTAMALAFDPLRRLAGITGVWQTAAASLDRVFTLLDRTPQILSPVSPEAFPPRDAPVQFDDVHLSYGGAPVLRGVSFTVSPGQTTAFVGPSAAGKSTIFKLLTRLVDPTSGHVRIGGVDVSSLELDDLRGLFSVVSQDTLLFDESLRENILLDMENVPDHRFLQAIDAAHVTDFLSNLDNGLDSAVGPRGSSLSGGQKQRVAIARAVLRDTPILLLDEPTSALDAQSEAAVQDALDRLEGDRTTLVIAHRLSTIRHADKIIVMEAGRVVDEGTHADLLARGGLYKTLHDLQQDEEPTALA